MDGFQKIKILVILVLVILGLVAIYLFATAGKNKDNQPRTSNVSMRAQQTSTFTIDEMLKQAPQGTNNYTSTQNHNPFGGNPISPINNNEQPQQQQNNAEIDALQAQLRENMQNQQVALQKVLETKNTEQATEPPKETQTSTPTTSVSVPPMVASAETNIATSTAAQEQPVEQKPEKKQRFFSGKEQQQVIGNSTRATVHGEQTVKSGGTLKMRLLEPIQTDNNVILPANTFVYGTVAFSEERVQIKITSVRINNNIYEMKKDVYDRDGIKGIYVPDNLKSDVKKTATGEAIDEADVDDVVGNQNILSKAVGTVGNAVKSVVGRNTQQQKVTIKTNYEIYLQ